MTDELSLLEEAVRANSVDRVRDVLSAHPSLRARLHKALPGEGFGATALIRACNNENREVADALIAAGADINQKSHWWAGGFGVLDHDGSRDMAEWLISRGARVDAYAAARWGLLDTLKEVVERDPSAVNMRGGDGQTPLHVASTVEVAAFLIDHGADINALDVDHESTPVQYLVQSHPDVARFLVDKGANADVFVLAALGNVDGVRRELERNPSCVNAVISNEHFPRKHPRAASIILYWTLGAFRSPHRIACDADHDAVVDLLLEHSSDGLKLAVACEMADEKRLEKLRASGIHLSRAEHDSLAARLVWAAELNRADAVKAYLASGWDANTVDRENVTALHWASWHGNVEAAAALVEHGARTDIAESMHKGTALDWAQHGRNNSWMRSTGNYDEVIATLTAAQR